MGGTECVSALLPKSKVADMDAGGRATALSNSVKIVEKIRAKHKSGAPERYAGDEPCTHSEPDYLFHRKPYTHGVQILPLLNDIPFRCFSKGYCIQLRAKNGTSKISRRSAQFP